MDEDECLLPLRFGQPQQCGASDVRFAHADFAIEQLLVHVAGFGSLAGFLQAPNEEEVGICGLVGFVTLFYPGPSCDKPGGFCVADVGEGVHGNQAYLTILVADGFGNFVGGRGIPHHTGGLNQRHADRAVRFGQRVPQRFRGLFAADAHEGLGGVFTDLGIEQAGRNPLDGLGPARVVELTDDKSLHRLCVFSGQLRCHGLGELGSICLSAFALRVDGQPV